MSTATARQRADLWGQPARSMTLDYLQTRGEATVECTSERERSEHFPLSDYRFSQKYPATTGPDHGHKV